MRTLSCHLPVCSASTQKGAPHVQQLNKIFKLHLTHLSHFLWHTYLKMYLLFVLIKGVKTHEHANACHDCFYTHSSLETRGTRGYTRPHGEAPEHLGAEGAGKKQNPWFWFPEEGTGKAVDRLQIGEFELFQGLQSIGAVPNCGLPGPGVITQRNRASWGVKSKSRR